MARETEGRGEGGGWEDGDGSGWRPASLEVEGIPTSALVYVYEEYEVVKEEKFVLLSLPSLEKD